jgi:epimerase transport system membrane fusion protein
VKDQRQIAHGMLDALDDTGMRRLGYLILLLIFGVFGLWAAFAPLDSAALAPGVVMVEGHRKTLQHLEGGIVREILVHNGDHVEKNQLLIRLDDTQLLAQLHTQLAAWFLSLARQARLLAESQGKVQVEFAPVLLEQSSDPRAAEAIQMQEQVFSARKAAHNGEYAVLQQRIAQLQSKVAGFEALKLSRQSLLSSYREELSDQQALLKEGYADKLRVRELQRMIAESEAQRADYLSSIASTQFQVGEARMQLTQLNRDFLKQTVENLEKEQAAINELREKITSLRQQVDLTQIRAPEPGKVMGLNLHTLGGVARPGENLLEIVPESDHINIEAHVAPVDVDRIRPGLRAEVHFSAFKSTHLPKIYGVVVNRSADRLMDPDTHLPYYSTLVSLTDETLRLLATRQLEVTPGMQADLLIITGERTLLQYLAWPVTAFLNKSLREP